MLGLWIAPTEGAVGIFGELKARGMEDCFIACVDGLKGLPEAIETVFPHARVQLCIVPGAQEPAVRTLEEECRFARYAAPSEEAALPLEAFETMREVPGYQEGLGSGA